MPTEIPPEPVLGDALRADFVRRNKVMPLSSDGNELVIALVDPFNHEPVRSIAFLTGRETILRIIAPAEFDKVFESLYVGSESDS